MVFKQRFYSFFIVMFFMGVSTGSATAQSEPVPPISAAACTPVARAFERVFCLEDIAIEQAHIDSIKQKFEDEGLNSEAALQSRNRERLKDMIWEEALRHKFGQEVLEPADEEIDLFSQSLKDSLAKSHVANKQSVRRVKALLAEGGHEPADELKLRNLLQTLETSIAFYEKRQKYNQDMPPEFHAMVKEAEREIAASMVRQWKTNKALYQAYGGRVVFQQAGLEPVDAYRAFIAYIRKEGQLEILDPGFKDIFAVMEKYAEIAEKDVIASDSTIPAKYFSSPFWQFEGQP